MSRCFQSGIFVEQVLNRLTQRSVRPLFPIALKHPSPVGTGKGNGSLKAKAGNSGLFLPVIWRWLEIANGPLGGKRRLQ